MSQKALKWLVRVFNFAATGVTIWWSGIWSSTPNWKLYGVFSLVVVLCGMSGFMAGYRKCAINHDIQGNL